MKNAGLNLIASRAAGLARLQDFLPRAGAVYTRERDIDRGAGQHQNVSGLSAYLRHRLITEQEVVAAVLQLHSFAASEKFVQEVCWRSYWKGWLQQRPAVWQQYRENREAQLAQVDGNSGLRAAYTEALQGRTGIDCFDAWAQELRDTGYLHNHARMWFASIWIFTLRLPWELGADLFLQKLIDGDAASNTLSWRWVGGLHTVGKHYLASAENIARYTEGRFNPAGQLNETAAALPAGPAAALVPLRPYASPLTNRRSALLISDEDCNAESLWPSAIAPPLCIGVWRGGIQRRSPAAMGHSAETFSQSALDDAISRAACTWPDAEIHECPDQNLDWLHQNRIKQLILAEPCTGASADSLDPQLEALSQAGVSIVRLRRDWDAAFWPQTTRGYFALRQQIPTLIDQLLGAA